MSKKVITYYKQFCFTAFLLLLLVACSQTKSNKEIIGKDGLTYRYINAGEFMMGCVLGDTLCDSIEKQQHKVVIENGFYISTTEVTVAAFENFIKATGYVPESITQNKGRVYTNDSNWHWQDGINWNHSYNKNNKDPNNYPVTQISFNDAIAYCKWAGGRLPTEEEWEYAARGGLTNQLFPWGNDWPPVKNGKPLANTADKNTLAVYFTMKGIKNYDDGFITIAPVASFPPNNFGLYDMAGNAWEWTATRFYKSYESKLVDSVFIKNDARIVRGGAWCYYPRQMRCSERGYFERDSFWTGSLGFRCLIDTIIK